MLSITNQSFPLRSLRLPLKGLYSRSIFKLRHSTYAFKQHYRVHAGPSLSGPCLSTPCLYRTSQRDGADPLKVFKMFNPLIGLKTITKHKLWNRNFEVVLQGLSILDLGFGFFVNNCLYIRLETFGNPQFCQQITKFRFEQVCLVRIRRLGPQMVFKQTI